MVWFATVRNSNMEEKPVELSSLDLIFPQTMTDNLLRYHLSERLATLDLTSMSRDSLLDVWHRLMSPLAQRCHGNDALKNKSSPFSSSCCPTEKSHNVSVSCVEVPCAGESRDHYRKHPPSLSAIASEHMEERGSSELKRRESGGGGSRTVSTCARAYTRLDHLVINKRPRNRPPGPETTTATAAITATNSATAAITATNSATAAITATNSATDIHHGDGSVVLKRPSLDAHRRKLKIRRTSAPPGGQSEKVGV